MSKKRRAGNYLTGKPSNNKGKKREAKVPRRSVLDMEILETKEESVDTDNEENLDHIPITAHMYRSAFIKQWCKKLVVTTIYEDPIVTDLLQHTPTETNCIRSVSEPPGCHTVDHWRTNIKVKGKPYTVPGIKRPGDRTVRDYHFWMYNSGNFTREQLATMVSPKNSKEDKEDSAGGSHTCGGKCLNHARPEPNKINQERKAHHKKMLEALEKGNIEAYIKVRTGCNHIPKCFINPAARGLNDIIIKANRQAYDEGLRVFQ